MRWMAKARGYIRHRAPFVAMYAISMLCVIGIAFFAGEDMSVALYTALIISFFFACIAVVDIDRYAKKLKTGLKRRIRTCLKNFAMNTMP